MILERIGAKSSNLFSFLALAQIECALLVVMENSSTSSCERRRERFRS